jgi:hypothetical protein
VRWLADENFNNNIIKGLLRRNPRFDIVRTQDTPLAGADDSVLLEGAAREGRMLLSHDVNTIVALAYERAVRGHRVSGVFVCRSSLPVALAIEEIATIDECSEVGEWEGRVLFLPLR